MTNSKELKNEVFEEITSNFNNIDDFYLKVSKEVIFGITKYIESFYEEPIDKVMAIQEFIILLQDLNKSDLLYSDFWNKVINRTNYNNEEINMLGEYTLHMVFKYISSALTTGVANRRIINEKNYKSKLLKKRD